MNRISVFVDIAGRPTRDTTGSPRVTAGSVLLDTSSLDLVRRALPVDFPKWKETDPLQAGRATDLLLEHSLCVAGSTVNRDTDAWRKALIDETILQRAILAESRKVAGWAKLPVLLVYELIGRASFRAIAHFLREHKGKRPVDYRKIVPVEFTVTCDQEISGEENLEVFRSFWEESRLPNKSLHAFGFHLYPPHVVVTTDDAEPLLRLADIAAGLVHSACLPSPGRITMPVSCKESRDLLNRLARTNRLSIDAFDYDATYNEVFGHVMQSARDC
jgi:hypothetical protein